MNLIYTLITVFVWYRYAPRLLLVLQLLVQERVIVHIVSISALCGVLSVAILAKKRAWYHLTSSHERAHAMMSLLLFSPVREYHINNDGSGSIAHAGRANRIISYAPYFLFPLSGLLILISLLLKTSILPAFLIVYGFSFGSRLLVILLDLYSFRIQRDITAYGTFWSLMTISGLLLLSLGILLAYLLHPMSLEGVGMFLL